MRPKVKWHFFQVQKRGTYVGVEMIRSTFRIMLLAATMSLLPLISGCLENKDNTSQTGSKGADDPVVQNSIQPTSPACSDSNIINISPSGQQTTFTSLDSAITAASTGYIIKVGNYNSSQAFRIQQKNNIAIQTECSSVIGGFIIVNSSFITINGFVIEVTPEFKPFGA